MTAARKLIREFAAGCGYSGDNPAMLSAYERIRQEGIREARKAHADRLKIVRAYRHSPDLFFVPIRPSETVDEFLEQSTKEIAAYFRIPTYRRGYHRPRICRLKEYRVFARYVRRYGARIWAERAA